MNYGGFIGWLGLTLAIVAGIFFGFLFIDLANFMN